MADFGGSLSAFTIEALVRFLGSLNKSGDLLVWRDQWIGQLSFDHGRLIGAAAECEVGEQALQFVVSVMTDGEFEFSEGTPSVPENLQLGADPYAVLEGLRGRGPQTHMQRLVCPTAIPQLRESQTDADTPVTLPRVAWRVLASVDGTRNVRQLASQFGLLATLRALDRLGQLALISFEVETDAVFGFIDEEWLPPGPDLGSSPAPGIRSTAIGTWPASPGHLGRAAHLRWRLPYGRARSVGLELAQAVVITGLFVISIRSLVSPFRVDGPSMQPNFDAGQALIVNKAAYVNVSGTPLAAVLPGHVQGSLEYLFGSPQRGDVVIFHAPPQPGLDYIKRIVGLPGDSVLIVGGRVFIDGAPLAEDEGEIPASYDFPQDGQPISVPDGQFFVLGDNRPDSFDSHYGWFVPADNVIGRVWLRYWPPNELGIVNGGSTLLASSPAGAQAE